MLSLPPAIVAFKAVESFPFPPPTKESSAEAVLPLPATTVALEPGPAVLFCPPPTKDALLFAELPVPPVIVE